MFGTKKLKVEEGMIPVKVHGVEYHIPFVTIMMLNRQGSWVTTVKAMRKARDLGVRVFNEKGLTIGTLTNCLYCSQYEHFGDFDNIPDDIKQKPYLRDGCHYERPSHIETGLKPCAAIDSLLEALAEDGVFAQYDASKTPESERIATVEALATRELQNILDKNPGSYQTVQAMERFVERLESVGLDCSAHREYIGIIKGQIGMK
jgi:hypothetical protein